MHPDSAGHFDLNSLAGADCSVCRLGLQGHSLPTFMAQEKACQGLSVPGGVSFSFLGIALKGLILWSSTLTAALEEQKFVLREFVSPGDRTSPAATMEMGFLLNTTQLPHIV